MNKTCASELKNLSCPNTKSSVARNYTSQHGRSTANTVENLADTTSSNTRDSLLRSIRCHELTSSLELLEKVGYVEEQALQMLAAIQLVGGAAL